MLVYGTLLLIGSYLIGMLYIFSKTQKRCTCTHCKTDIHLERTTKPSYFKRYYNFLPLKAYRCRRCAKTFFIHNETPGVEPIRMDEQVLSTAPRTVRKEDTVY